MSIIGVSWSQSNPSLVSARYKEHLLVDASQKCEKTFTAGEWNAKY